MFSSQYLVNVEFPEGFLWNILRFETLVHTELPPSHLLDPSSDLRLKQTGFSSS